MSTIQSFLISNLQVAKLDSVRGCQLQPPAPVVSTIESESTNKKAFREEFHSPNPIKACLHHEPHEQRETESQGESTGSQEEAANMQVRMGLTQLEARQRKTIDFIKLSREELIFNRKVIFPGGKETLQLSVGLQNYAIRRGSQVPTTLEIRVVNLTQLEQSTQPIFMLSKEGSDELVEHVRYNPSEDQQVQVKIVAHGPSIKQQTHLKGQIVVRLDDFQPHILPMEICCEIPRIVSGRELYDVDSKVNVIKLPVRKQVKITPLQFKNQCSYGLSFQVELARIPSDDTTQQAYDLHVQGCVNSLGNSPFMINFQLLINDDFVGEPPETQTIRRILILRLKNSSLYFFYPLEAFVFQSSYSGSLYS